MKKLWIAPALGIAVLFFAGLIFVSPWQSASAQKRQPDNLYPLPRVDDRFQVEVLVDGSRVPEYAARGRRYVQAQEGAEYSLRIRNPLPVRVAVTLAVDGLNTIDARHTSAWDGHKWVIGPYGTIEIGGWQMSSSRARRFYFTTERDSYAAKLGQPANVGVISAVFYREKAPLVVTRPEPLYRNEDRAGAPQAGTSESSRSAPKSSRDAYPGPDDESAATGIGRSVRNDVQWVRMDLDSRPAGEVTIRYEYRAGLVRLGIIPREYPRQDVLDRRERAKGFEYCPEP